nr:hypothetical protein CJLB15_00016 [Campylobacter phage CJLB-15]
MFLVFSIILLDQLKMVCRNVNISVDLYYYDIESILTKFFNIYVLYLFGSRQYDTNRLYFIIQNVFDGVLKKII